MLREKKYSKCLLSSVMSNRIISLVFSLSIVRDWKRGPGPQLPNLWAFISLYVEFLDLRIKILQAKAHFIIGVHSFICSFLLGMPNALSPSTTRWGEPCFSSSLLSTKSKLGTSSGNLLTTLFHLEPSSVWRSCLAFRKTFTCKSHQ